MSFHEGELEVQARAGLASEAAKMANFMKPELRLAAAQFLAMQRMLLVSTIARDGRVSASVLAGELAFAHATTLDTVRIEPSSGHLERVFSDLASNPSLGLIAIDFASKRRVRVNGRATVHRGAITLTTREVYTNCPQHIHPRDTPSLRFDEAAPFEFVSRADTFFIASAHPEAGADISHRGGPPGFVRIDGPDTLSWEDYPGNNMFNTLGNLARNPNAGLLFIDFANRRTLQLSGTARVEWSEPRRVVFNALPAGSL
jgi:predicted pyridoxine 5'-phosphate oxidase superfamily flavin-nucleotide-binding protein